MELNYIIQGIMYLEKLIELDKQNKLSDYIQESIIFFYEVYENEKTLKQQ